MIIYRREGSRSSPDDFRFDSYNIFSNSNAKESHFTPVFSPYAVKKKIRMCAGISIEWEYILLYEWEATLIKRCYKSERSTSSLVRTTKFKIYIYIYIMNE